ncbi:MAG: ribosome maturation factor RimM [Bacillota bacterium]|nr:ribosome maturation factor RimM [Bacillota bacterium]
MEEYLEIGKIINVHGVKGELKVLPLTDDPSRYDELKWAYIEKEGQLKRYDFQGVKYFKGFVFLKLKGIDAVEDAELLKNLFIKVDRKNAVKLPENSYFICDLIGCEVLDENDNKLGILNNIISTGSNDVYIVKDENDREILIPALKSVVREISVDNKIIRVTLPEGLI